VSLPVATTIEGRQDCVVICLVLLLLPVVHADGHRHVTVLTLFHAEICNI